MEEALVVIYGKSGALAHQFADGLPCHRPSDRKRIFYWGSRNIDAIPVTPYNYDGYWLSVDAPYKGVFKFLVFLVFLAGLIFSLA